MSSSAIKNLTVRKKGIHPKLTHSIEQMLTDLHCYYPYYGEMCSYINFYESDFVPTCGVRFTASAMEFYWNRKFLDELTQEEVNFVMVHELYHLLFSHTKRTLQGGYNHKLSNYAQDMIINEIIIQEIKEKFAKVPKKIGPIMMPEEYKGERVFEILYEWLKDQKKKYDEWKKDQSEDTKSDEQGESGSGGSSNGQGEQGKEEKEDQDGGSEDDEKPQGKKKRPDDCPVSDDLADIFDAMDRGDSFDVHLPDDVPENIRDQMVQDVVNAIKNRGHTSGHFDSVVGKLRKKRKNHLKDLKRMLAYAKGTHKSPSWKRGNRRGLTGYKGKVKHSIMINCILDTSGSMNGYFDKILSYIFQDGYSVNVIQCDAKVQKEIVVTEKQQLQKMMISGLGGTILQPAIEYIKENKLHKFSTVVLTDGYTDELDFTGLARSLIISCGVETPHKGRNVRSMVVAD
jgi:predicted metal-dependent peptidase